MKHAARMVIFVLILASPASGGVEWFREDFSDGSLGSGWRRDGVEWTLEPEGLSVSTAAYDRMFSQAFSIPATAPFTIVVTLRGLRAGLFFSLDDTTSKAFSHMVRFDENAVLAGYFNGAGEYTATSVFEVEPVPDGWNTLRVDIDPGAGRYDISVNDRFVGRDTTLRFPSGYFGLQASDGISEFRDITIAGAAPLLPSAIPTTGEIVRLEHIAWTRAAGTDLIVANPALGMLQTINPQGRLVSQTPLTISPAPRLSARLGDRTCSLAGNVILVRESNGMLVDSVSDQLNTPAELVADQEFIYVVDAGLGAVLKFDKQLQLSAIFRASSIGGFKAPRGLDLYGTRELVIADYDRLVIVDRGLEEVIPRVQHLSPDSVQVTWPRITTGEPVLLYQADGQHWSRKSGAVNAGSDTNSVTLTGLTPLTRYSFRFSGPIRTIPETQEHSLEHRFATKSRDPFTVPYSHLPVLLMVYRTISYRDRYPAKQFPEIPWGRTITDAELEYLKEAARFNEEFYFRNSGCSVALDFDVSVVEDTLWLRDVGPSDPYWLSPNRRVTLDYETACAALGKRPEEYVGLVCPYAWVNYPSRRTSALGDPSTSSTINIRQAYGGGTNGVPAPWKYGKSTGYTGNPFQDRFSRQDWLITHEFHHQIDALMETSGYAAYFHADQPWKMPGAFGEDFDFNALIIRNADSHRWLDLKFGTLRSAKDVDQDGVPDDDPSLPFDEKRLGGNPSSADTDEDGLTDIAEVMAGTSRGAGINNPDTDADTLPDGEDPWPLYAITPHIFPYSSPLLSDLHPFGSVRTDSLAVSLDAGWNTDGLVVAVTPEGTAPRTLNLLLQIDAENDGWFHGFDNYQIRVSASRDSLSVVDYYLRDCSSRVNPPQDRKDILHTEDLDLFRHPTRTGAFAVRIPQDTLHGFHLRKGQQLTVRLGVQSSGDRWVWAEMLERNAMMMVELK